MEGEAPNAAAAATPKELEDPVVAAEVAGEAPNEAEAATTEEAEIEAAEAAAPEAAIHATIHWADMVQAIGRTPVPLRAVLSKKGYGAPKPIQPQPDRLEPKWDVVCCLFVVVFSH